MGILQPRWNKNEAAILLYYYLKVISGELTRKAAISECSKDLRLMATNQGFAIDKVYRNANGIALQLSSMESAFMGKTVGIPASRLFMDIANLYKTNRTQFEDLLNAAKALIMNEKKSEEESKTNSTIKSDLELRMHQNITDISTPYNKEEPTEQIVLNFQEKTLQVDINFPNAENSINESEGSNGFDEKTDRDTLNRPEGKALHMQAILCVDFNKLDNLEFSKPYSFTYQGVERLETTWNGLYVDICTLLVPQYRDCFSRIREQCVNGFASRNVWIVDEMHMHSLKNPKEIAENYFIETNRSASNLMKNLKWILDECNIDYKSLTIYYYTGQDASINKAKRLINPIQGNAYYREDKESFYRWLKNEQLLAERTSQGYVSAIERAERFAEEQQLPFKKLYTDNFLEAKATADALFACEQFIILNNEQHNRFSAAISKYLEFKGGETIVKITKTEKTNKWQETNLQADKGVGEVLKTYYEYGFKYDSIRELMRFRQFSAKMGVSLPENDIDLKALIIASGTVINDKVYCVSDSFPKELEHIVNTAFSTGASVLYFDCIFENEEKWMEDHAIASADRLKEYLEKYISGCSFSKQFMKKGNKCTEKDAVTKELKRVWGTCSIENVDDLKMRLPYIPIKNIWRVITGNDSFVLAAEGEYFLVDRLILSQEEVQNIVEYVDESCDEKGFCSLTDIPLKDVADNNYDLSKMVIYNAVYKVALADKYHLNGKILTKNKPELDAVVLLKQYIRGKRECTFDEAAEKVVELTGGTNRQYALQALYDEMVRVDKNRFVSDNAINFDVNEIDRVLATFIINHFIAIRDITTFAMFPLCGQNWNHYLLESFCYKYSQKYSLHVVHFNDKNAGIIAEKDYKRSYFLCISCFMGVPEEVHIHLPCIGR